MIRSRSAVLVLALGLALQPIAALAETSASSSPAGFAPSLWVSASSITDGDSVKIYTVVYDSTPDPIEGTVVFLVDGSSVGSQSFTLAAGGNAVVSAPWKATSGSHALSARIDGPVSRTTKQPVVLADTAASVNVKVADAPPPSTIAKAAGAAADAATAAAPAVKGAVNVIVDNTEALRSAGEQYFADKVAADDAALAPSVDSDDATSSGAVLGTTTYRAPVAANAMHSVNKALLSLFATPALFYLAILLLLLFLFWMVRRQFGTARA